MAALEGNSNGLDRINVNGIFGHVYLIYRSCVFIAQNGHLEVLKMGSGKWLQIVPKI